MVFDTYREETLKLGNKIGKFNNKELQVLHDDEQTSHFVLALSLKPVDSTLDHNYMNPSEKMATIKLALDDAKFAINCLMSSYYKGIDNSEEYRRHLKVLRRIERQLEKQRSWANKQVQLRWEQNH